MFNKILYNILILTFLSNVDSEHTTVVVNANKTIKKTFNIKLGETFKYVCVIPRSYLFDGEVSIDMPDATKSTFTLLPSLDSVSYHCIQIYRKEQITFNQQNIKLSITPNEIKDYAKGLHGPSLHGEGFKTIGNASYPLKTQLYAHKFNEDVYFDILLINAGSDADADTECLRYIKLKYKNVYRYEFRLHLGTDMYYPNYSALKFYYGLVLEYPNVDSAASCSSNFNRLIHFGSIKSGVCKKFVLKSHFFPKEIKHSEVNEYIRGSREANTMLSNLYPFSSILLSANELGREQDFFEIKNKIGEVEFNDRQPRNNNSEYNSYYKDILSNSIESDGQFEREQEIIQNLRIDTSSNDDEPLNRMDRDTDTRDTHTHKIKKGKDKKKGEKEIKDKKKGEKEIKDKKKGEKEIKDKKKDKNEDKDKKKGKKEGKDKKEGNGKQNKSLKAMFTSKLYKKQT
eukprot:GHVR01034851.1.p1 GENE.GHVR01034851.1~~GHVR01034851.1.p1  ORF type:complete len:456 (+),score=104.04 GHVR01034851.1:152-1519(+)